MSYKKRKISIIIPIYNDEKYLEQCIESVIKQTIGIENIEVILIDDNSKDNSFKICQLYEKKYPENVKIIKLNKNSGSGGKPRNIGIENASGKYLMFSDADDFFDLNAFETMYNAIESKNADFVISNWKYIHIDGTLYKEPVFDLKRFKNFKLSKNDYKDSFWIMNSSMCNKIFKREFIIKNKIKCLENVNGEDTYFSDSAFLHSKNVYYIKDVTYYYRQRNNSYKETSTSYKCDKKFFDGMNYSYKKIYNMFVDFKQIEFYRFLYARNMTYLLCRFIDSEQLNYDEKEQVLNELKWFFKLSITLKVPPCQKSLEILVELIIEDKIKEAIELCSVMYELRKYIEPETRKKISKPTEILYNKLLNNSIVDVNKIKKVI